MFDLDGCGSADDRTTLEGILERQLSNRWGNRAAAIVIDPELDIWAWGGMFHLASAVNWKVEKSGNLNQWLIERKGKWISRLFTPPECWVERTEI